VITVDPYLPTLPMFPAGAAGGIPHRGLYAGDAGHSVVRRDHPGAADV